MEIFRTITHGNINIQLQGHNRMLKNYTEVMIILTEDEYKKLTIVNNSVLKDSSNGPHGNG